MYLFSYRLLKQLPFKIFKRVCLYDLGFGPKGPYCIPTKRFKYVFIFLQIVKTWPIAMVELCLIPLFKATATQFSQCRISINNDQTMSEKLENTKMKKQESSLLEVSGKVTNIKLTPIPYPDAC